MSAAPSPQLAVSVVLFHSSPDMLRITLDALHAQDPAVGRIVVLVNEASDTDRERLADLAASALLRFEAGNHGFAGGHNRNLAFLFAEGADGVLVLNPDLRLAPDALHRLWAVAHRHGGRCLVGPLLERGGEGLQPTGQIDSAGIRWTASARHLDDLQGEPISAAPTGDVQVAGLTGACLLVPRAAYDTIVAVDGEFFDEDFVAYREDADLALRCAAMGITSWLAGAARGVHARGLRGTTRNTSRAINRLGVQNRFLLLLKHGRRRPGNSLLSTGRDVLVLAAAATVERSSWPGVRRAWALRGRMRDKRRALERLRA